ncbi:hypothetical protein MCHIJ_41470 [Mycolicibacterium chitae]|uniref:Protein of uncharacterized function (DUF1214) n=1 Tax=Mycolicibacterium chitae TaxID=1792 RepID=A0A3S4VC13_MYCCI|nr:DUF1214 domain-containing protein [Mycolicibacterium chitae]MCV7105861.1 DUF1214 domain-containing protein [Mycolicibacterium chitae]BBZ04710.1 hypothetical protein MCHIJ_41470 [Mycolicibacterium chitae]VEG48340.1 Protein of uncharacterised function (DUF1214) [Mycolicibacterium chitae]
MTAPESAAAWRELLSAFAEFDQQFLSGPKAVRGEVAVAEGYHNLATMLALTLDMSLFADPVAPRFIDTLTPFRPDRRWGGDNTDCYYSYAMVDPRRTYRVSGAPGDSAMYSVTVYNEPEPGAWPNRTVGLLYDTDMPLDDDGRFSCVLGPARPDGYDGPFIELSPDAHGIITRDYHEHPETGRRVDWEISVLDHAGLPVKPAKTDAAVANSLRSALRFAQDMYALIPLILMERTPIELADGQALTTNTIAPPYRAGGATHGYSMQDACYGLGGFALEPGEALVITSRHPKARFWNFTLWNQYMAALDVDYGRAGINSGTAVPNSDGTVTIVVSRELLEHPNAISTKDHPEGLMSFRWFHADDLPEQPTTAVVPVAEAPRELS